MTPVRSGQAVSFMLGRGWRGKVLRQLAARLDRCDWKIVASKEKTRIGMAMGMCWLEPEIEVIWWAAQDSNLEPSRYERRALPLS